MRLRSLAVALAGILPAACAGGTRTAPAPPLAAAAGVDTLLLREVSRELAGDAYEGRKTGTTGAEAAAVYLAHQCRTHGLEPVGSDDYFQLFPLLESIVDPALTRVRVVGPDVDSTFTHHEEFLVDHGTAETLTSFAGELAYVGRAADLLFRRSDLPPLTGRVALMRGELGAYLEAADTLRARGAVGIVQVVDDARRYRLFRQTRGASRLAPATTARRPAAFPSLPAVLAGPRMTVTLYRGLTGLAHGSWNDAYLNGLAAGLPSPRVLAGWRVQVEIGVRARPARARNVLCVLPGRGPARDTALALVAHYDHLGIGAPDERGDSIYNGFSDNAAGVAMALGIAEQFARARARGDGLRHSLLLVFPSGEEQGLLGTHHFLEASPWPLDRLRAVVNLDANVPPGRATEWRVAGREDDAVTRAVLEAAAARGWRAAVAPPAPGSDYFAFLERGVPAVFAVPAGGTFEGYDILASDSLRAAMWQRYHQPGDAYDDAFPFEGLARYAEFMGDVLRRLDGTRGRVDVAGRGGQRAGASFTEPGGSR